MKMPKEILVYIADYDDGKSVFAVAKDVSEIPEHLDGEIVGNYLLNRQWRFKVRRELIG